MADASDWPALPLEEWKATCDTLHMYAQIAGKIKLALAPAEPRVGPRAFYLTARGLGSGPLPYGERTLGLDFDFISHEFSVLASDGAIRSIPLGPGSVATFYLEVMAALRSLDAEVQHSRRCRRRSPNPIPSIRSRARDRTIRLRAAFLADARTHRSRLQAAPRTFSRPSHARAFFWGTFDLAYERFSGRSAVPPPNADAIARESMDAKGSRRVLAGRRALPRARLLLLCVSEAAGLESAAIEPAAAFWSAGLGEFLLRYEDVRTAAAPREEIARFLATTYDACAKLAGGVEEARMSQTMPAVFFGHGNPMNALQDNAFTQAWSALGAASPAAQSRARDLRALVSPRHARDRNGDGRGRSMISAASRPNCIAPGTPPPAAPALARRVQALLAPL